MFSAPAVLSHRPVRAASPAPRPSEPRPRAAGVVGLILSAFLLGSLTSCGGQQPAGIHAPGLGARKGVVEVAPVESGRVVAGQTIYVPAYSSVATSDRAHGFNLAVTLSIRNTDRTHPIVVASAGYYDQDGQLVRDYLKKPLRIGPMASIELFVAEGDTSGGASASFLVEWVAERSASAPLVESVMIGTASTQGVSFTCPGRVLADRSRGEERAE
jgi:Protein of unknown function (DUF3124)